MSQARTPWTALDAKQELARRAKLELEKRRSTPEFKRGVIAALRAELFDHQLAVLDDPSPRIAACCSRRAGKSELAARMIIIALLNSGHNDTILFSARTLARARQIVWPILSRINDDMGLGFRMSEHIGQVTTPEGAVMLLLGVDDAISVEKVRGSRFRLAVLDEASTYEGLLERLILDAIEPGCLDFSPRGRIVVTGTPGYAQSGHWFQIATGKRRGWSHHYWTLRDNPHIPDVDAALAGIREGNGWDEMDPTYRREYLGHWVADESTLVYPFNPQVNTCDWSALPQPPSGKTVEQWIRDDWSVTVGADIGFTDAFAVAALGSPPHSKDCYFLESHSQTGLLAEEQAAWIQRYREKYRAARTVMDAGGSGKLVHAEFTRRYGGGASPASKMNKLEAVGMFGSDMRSGRIRALPGAKGLAAEWAALVWSDDSKTTVDKHIAKDHTTDAALYAWRAHTAYLNKAAPEAPTPAQLEEQAQERRMQKAKRSNRDW